MGADGTVSAVSIVSGMESIGLVMADTEVGGDRGGAVGNDSETVISGWVEFGSNSAVSEASEVNEGSLVC